MDAAQCLLPPPVCVGPAVLRSAAHAPAAAIVWASPEAELVVRWSPEGLARRGGESAAAAASLRPAHGGATPFVSPRRASPRPQADSCDPESSGLAVLPIVPDEDSPGNGEPGTPRPRPALVAVGALALAAVALDDGRIFGVRLAPLLALAPRSTAAAEAVTVIAPFLVRGPGPPLSAMSWTGDGAGLLAATAAGAVAMLAPPATNARDSTAPWVPLWIHDLAPPRPLDVLAAGPRPWAPACALASGVGPEVPILVPRRPPPGSPVPSDAPPERALRLLLRSSAPVLGAAWSPGPVDDPSLRDGWDDDDEGPTTSSAGGAGAASSYSSSTAPRDPLRHYGRGSAALLTWSSRGEVRVWVRVPAVPCASGAGAGASSPSSTCPPPQRPPPTPPFDFCVALSLDPSRHVPRDCPPPRDCRTGWVLPLEAGRLPGPQDVWWIATVCPPQVAPPGGASLCPSSSTSHVLLWAVQGLSHGGLPPSEQQQQRGGSGRPAGPGGAPSTPRPLPVAPPPPPGRPFGDVTHCAPFVATPGEKRAGDRSR